MNLKNKVNFLRPESGSTVQQMLYLNPKMYQCGSETTATYLCRSVSCGVQQDRVGQKSYEVLTYQIWSLLPGYCTHPTDLLLSFKAGPGSYTPGGGWVPAVLWIRSWIRSAPKFLAGSGSRINSFQVQIRQAPILVTKIA